MFMYKPEIFNGIVKFLTDREIKDKSLTYGSLYEKLSTHLGRKLSHRDYNSHLKNMMEQKILYKEEIEGKGSSRYYHLTENARKQHRLKILGIGQEYDKRLSLYHILIYFEALKRGQILNDKQLDRFLAKYGSSMNKLKKINVTHDNNPLINVEAAYEEPVHEIGIMKLSSNRFGIRSMKPMYYVLMLGFSQKEFISYIRKLRNNKEPRPFSRYPALVPFVHFESYSAKEVENAINLLEKSSLLRPITFSVEKEEKRFRVDNNGLIKLIQQMRIIEIIYFYKIVIKIAFLDKPDQEEKDTLVYYFGEKNADHVIAFLSDERRKYLKNYTRQQLQEKKALVTVLDNQILSLAAFFGEQHREMLQDEFLRELYLPFAIYNEH